MASRVELKSVSWWVSEKAHVLQNKWGRGGGRGEARRDKRDESRGWGGNGDGGDPVPGSLMEWCIRRLPSCAANQM